MIVEHDAHIHTNLSACCTDPAAVPEKIIARAAKAGLKTIGLANHLWDRAVPGASEWYAPQDLDHILSIRDQIPADTGGVRVLVGCETEYCGGGKVGISPEGAKKLDYVLIPFSHTHMKGFVVPESTTAADLPELLTRRFREVVDLGLATGIAHPFLPLGFTDHLDEIMAAISDADLEDCFGRATEAGVSIEIHVGMFPGQAGSGSGGLHDETFLRVMTIARRAGCLFHFASDSHELADVGCVKKLGTYAEKLEITKDRVFPLFR